ncbi:conserved protein of unknown function [Candidatus Promineifilum breve]|uniref:Uncharacterized protein n=1 Tax=Candidatus Promineifilum breve TaxID=1806508 RepID=A0A160T0Q2_9CHLR|nr:hypothetical protein [Candidatus Promineifilum breve]CUS03531.2 conserved protein of unknown function [Candidatus Promineifilum breve]
MDIHNMPDEGNRGNDPSRPTVYEIRIRGHLGQQWQEWFMGLTIVLQEDGNTRLTGAVVDQAALHGILKKVRDLGMPLLAVTIVGSGPLDDSLGAGTEHV